MPDGGDRTPLLGTADVARLRDALRSAGFTRQNLADRLGVQAVRQLERGDTGPLLPVAAEDSGLGTLIRLFLLASAVPRPEAVAALAGIPLEPLVNAGFLETGTLAGDLPAVRARIRIYPYHDSWLLADALSQADDLVIGLSRYPAVLAAARVDQPVGSALDVCAGSGVQSLHLSAQARRVTAIDLSGRALRFAATTAALAGLDWELLRGNLLEPVAGRRFDLVVANPPFIVKPGTVEYLYRDSGMHLDSLGARLAAAAPGVLAEGGTMQYLASFVHPRGGDWAERVAAWVAGTGLDAWIVQLGETDPQGYVQTWSSGHDMSLKERAAWLAWLGEQDVASIGWGLVTLRASGRDDPCVRVENRPGHEPRGAEVRAWFTRHDWLRDHDPLAARYLAADGVALTQVARLAGPHGWEVGRHLVSNGAGAPVEVNQLVVDLIEGCDGTLTARDLVAKLAAAHGLDPAELTETAATAIPRLVEYGSLIPA